LRFLARHEDIEKHWSNSYQPSRANACTKERLGRFYDQLKEVYDKYQLNEHCIFNMDECGIYLDYGNLAVIVRKGDHQARDTGGGSKEIITVVSCCCADGSYLRPTYIFKGVNINSAWFHENVAEASISTSDTGWNNCVIGCSWLEHVFLPHRQNLRNSQPESGGASNSFKWIMLIVDGHVSHLSFRFLCLCKEHDILLLCLPTHTSHLTQPLDVSIFGPFGKKWTRAFADFGNRTGGVIMTKDDFPRTCGEAYIASHTPENSISGFRKSGMWPYNREAIAEDEFNQRPQSCTWHKTNTNHRDY
jgi:hypothetical protein